MNLEGTQTLRTILKGRVIKPRELMSPTPGRQNWKENTISLSSNPSLFSTELLGVCDPCSVVGRNWGFASYLRSKASDVLLSEVTLCLKHCLHLTDALIN